MKLYCVKCKSKTGDVSLQPVVTKNGRLRLSSKCVICGNKKSQFVSKSDIKNGGNLGKLFAPLLSKVSGPVLKEAAKKVLPAAALATITGAISGGIEKAIKG